MKTKEIGCMKLKLQNNTHAMVESRHGLQETISKEHAKEAIKWLQEFVDYDPWTPKVGEKYNHDHDSARVYMRVQYEHPEYVDKKRYGWTCVDLTTGALRWTPKDEKCFPVK